jgi:hypothetical protein
LLREDGAIDRGRVDRHASFNRDPCVDSLLPPTTTIDGTQNSLDVDATPKQQKGETSA